MNITCIGFYDEEFRFIVILVVWELIRKAITLYKAWKRGDKLRFALIFILNTCGLLPIVYLLLNKNKHKRN